MTRKIKYYIKRIYIRYLIIAKQTDLYNETEHYKKKIVNVINRRPV